MSSWVPSLFNPSDDDDPVPNSSSGISGIKKDLEEFKGTLKNGLSLISSKITSKFFKQNHQPKYDDDDDDVSEEEEGIDVIGIDQEVLDFATKISNRPELWTQFPLDLPNDVDMSDYQKEHAASIDQLVPELVTLRQKIFSQISYRKFWLIYFILLLPRLCEEDLMLLSTPEVVDARETLLKKLQKKSSLAQETSECADTSDTNKDMEGDQKTFQNNSISVETSNSTKQIDVVNEAESGHHLEEVETRKYIDDSTQSEGVDVSFSDLEDDDKDLPRSEGSESNKLSEGEVREWIRLKNNSVKRQAGKSGARWNKESESEGSNEWFNVNNDSDFDSVGEISSS